MKFVKLFEQSLDFSQLFNEEYVSSAPLFIVSKKETSNIGSIFIDYKGNISDKSKEILYNPLFFYLIRLLPEIDIHDISIYYYFEQVRDIDYSQLRKSKSESLLNFLNTDNKTKPWWLRLISNSKVSSVDLPIQHTEEFQNSKERFIISINNAKFDYSKM